MLTLLSEAEVLFEEVDPMRHGDEPIFPVARMKSYPRLSGEIRRLNIRLCRGTTENVAPPYR
jgi:hypothetical protein